MATLICSNAGRIIRNESKGLLATVEKPSFSQENIQAHKRLNARKRSFDTQKTSNEKFLARREREYNIIRSHKSRNCYKQLAIFVKYEDGSKYLCGLVDFHRKGKKLFGGSLKPVLWFDVSMSGKISLNRMIDVGDTLPESVMRDMLGIHDKDVRVYAQSLDSIKAPRNPARQLQYEHIQTTHR